MVAAATPKGAVALAADDWPEIDIDAFGAAQFERGGAAETLVSAIERAEGPFVLRGLALLLGAARSAAHVRCAAQIVAQGGRAGAAGRSSRVRNHAGDRHGRAAAAVHTEPKLELVRQCPRRDAACFAIPALSRAVSASAPAREFSH